jgi:TRAP-type mannitol/chloroaromatic compound transport system permease small subunit
MRTTDERPKDHRAVAVIEAAIDRIGRATAWLCLVLVVLVAINVLLRYVFRIGPVALQELEWHLMSPIALLGMSYALRHGDHVRVDIFYERFGRRLREAVDLAAALAAIGISAVLIKLSLGFVEQAYALGEGSPDPGGLPHRFLLRGFIPLGFALLMAQAAAQALRSLLRLSGRA